MCHINRYPLAVDLSDGLGTINLSNNPGQLGPVFRRSRNLNPLDYSCYVNIFFIRTEATFIQEISGVYNSLSFNTINSENGFSAQKGFRGFRETGPRLLAAARTFCKQVKIVVQPARALLSPSGRSEILKPCNIE